MGLELHLAPPKASENAREHVQPQPHTSSRPQIAKPNQPNPTKPREPREPRAASQPIPLRAKPRPAAKPRDKPSSAAAAAPAAHTTARKEDPSRAQALPPTLAPDGSGSSHSRAAAFSADSFSKLPLEPYLIRQLGKLGLDAMTPVQRQVIPSVVSGRDVLVRSPTGSGKTLAYAVPLVQRLLELGAGVVTRAAGTFGIVLVPTRELAVQSHEVVESLCHPFPWIVTTTLMGGERRKAEKARLRKGVALIIATPGRLGDHVDTTCAFNLLNCSALVLDEADRLLQMGFADALEKITNALDARVADSVPRVSVLLSATLPRELRDLAGRMLQSPLTVDVSAASAAATAAASPRAGAADDEEAPGAVGRLEAPQQLRQSYVMVPPKARLTALATFLRSVTSTAAATGCKVLVFVSSCDGVDFLFDLLSLSRWPTLEEARAATGHAPSKGAAASAEVQKPRARPERWWDDDSDEDALGGDDDDESAADAARAAEAQTPLVSSVSAARAAGGSLKSDSKLIGAPLLRLHGQLKQPQRLEVFRQFRSLDSGVLLCTDVASRGLNLEGVHWIVQLDLPQDPREYVHRVGRTARLGQLGQALLLLMPSEAPYLELLRGAGMGLGELRFASFQAAIHKGGSTRDIYLMELALQRAFEEAVLAQPLLHASAAAAFHAYIRSYATHSKAVKRVLHVGQLHLGHLCKSFALRETPATLARQGQKQRKQQAPAKRRRAVVGGGGYSKRPAPGEGGSERAAARALAASEFAAEAVF